MPYIPFYLTFFIYAQQLRMSLNFRKIHAFRLKCPYPLTLTTKKRVLERVNKGRIESYVINSVLEF